MNISARLLVNHLALNTFLVSFSYKSLFIFALASPNRKREGENMLYKKNSHWRLEHKSKKTEIKRAFFELI